MSNIKGLKTQVIRILVKDEASRNSDIRLMQCVWFEFYREKLFMNSEGYWCVRINNLFELPREDNIKRIRAKIQNEQHDFLPTDQAVRRARQIKEEDWRKYLGYNPEMRTVE